MAEEKNQSVPAASKMRRTANGDVDVMHAVGGVRGILEALLPGLLFLTTFILTQKLMLALALAGVISIGFALTRLLQKGSLVQALSGLAGLAICAWVALRSGNAEDFYLPGLLTNLIYAPVFLATVFFRVPVMGFIFSFIRSEFETWRNDPQRIKAYSLATLVMVALFVLRLLVQYPLYLAENITLLGIARLIMGVPLYAAALWISWMVSRPSEVVEAEMAQNQES